MRKILLAGQGPLLCRAVAWFQSEAGRAYQLIGVYPWIRVRQAREAGWSPRHEEEKPLQQLLKHYQLYEIQHPGGLNDLKWLQQLRASTGVDTLLIASWGEKITEATLQSTESQILWLNIHPALLPGHRGPNPYISTIRAGEAQSGVTLHAVEKDWDTGPIYHQLATAIQPFDTGGSLRESCAALVPDLLETGLAKVASKEWPTPQAAGGRYFSGRFVNQSALDWRLPPDELERWHRAVQPWFYLTSSTASGRPILVRQLRLKASSKSGRRWPLPGTVLAVNSTAVELASVEPGYLIQLTQFQLAWCGQWLPEAVSRRLAPWVFQVGEALSNRDC